MDLQEFQFIKEHRLGTQNGNADELSKLEVKGRMSAQMKPVLVK